MSKQWLTAMLLICVTACGHDDDVVETSPCEQMRDHLIDLGLADTSSVDRDAHRAILARTLGESFVASCDSSMSSSQIGCVLNADDSESASTCMTSGGAQ